MKQFKYIVAFSCLVMLMMASKANAQLLDSVALDSARTFFSLESAMKSPDQVYVLKLSKKKLNEFPMEVLQFKNLNYLDLSKNKIKSIPDEISQLQFLQHLDVSRNQIELFTPALCELVNLRNLIIFENEMEGFPEEIANLTKLVRLDAWSNNLTYFPFTMTHLVSLEWMDLRVIQMNAETQKRIKEMLPNVRIYFSPSCNCNF